MPTAIEMGSSLVSINKPEESNNPRNPVACIREILPAAIGRLKVNAINMRCSSGDTRVKLVV